MQKHFAHKQTYSETIFPVAIASWAVKCPWSLALLCALIVGDVLLDSLSDELVAVDHKFACVVDGSLLSSYTRMPFVLPANRWIMCTTITMMEPI